jgi:glucose/arabinose dehydrogenase
MTRFVCAIAILNAFALSACAQVGEAKDEMVKDRPEQTFMPKQVPMTDQLVAELKIPTGFHVNVFAKNLGKPRMMAAGADGTIYFTRREQGDVVALRDRNHDGVADEVKSVVTGYPQMHGITIHGDQMFLATIKQVFVAPVKDERVGQPKAIVDNLPEAIRHKNRTLGVGPDNRLYITIGSTGNCNLEPDSRNAGMLRCDLDGNNIEIFCSGLRNTLGFDWHPATHELWGVDNGIDYLGEDQPPEELNKLEKGKNYGWPYCYGKSQPTPLDVVPPNLDQKKWIAQATASVLEFTPHVAPLQCVFYRQPVPTAVLASSSDSRGRLSHIFPDEYVGNLFVCIHGSGNRHHPAGYEIDRVIFDAKGQAAKIQPFLTGFLQGKDADSTFFGRPCGIAEAPDGSLYFSDDYNGLVYRITHD